jgi:hypothetical protein
MFLRCVSKELVIAHLPLLRPLQHGPKRETGSLQENPARSFRCEVRKGKAAALEKGEEATSGGRRENQGNRSRSTMNAERREVEIE